MTGADMTGADSTGLDLTVRLKSRVLAGRGSNRAGITGAAR